MLKLIKTSIEYKGKYIEIIDEWQKYGGTFEKRSY